MSADNVAMHEKALALARTAGMDLSTDDMAQLAALYERFATDRATLAGALAGETEPATIFQAAHQDDRR